MHYLFYIIGVSLLVMPTGLIGRRTLCNVTLRDFVERTRSRLVCLHWVNFVDLGRAWAGLVMVREAFVRIDPGANSDVVTLATVAVASLAGLALRQWFSVSDDDDMVAPVAYAIGLIFAFMPPQVALLALPLGLAAALGLRSLNLGFILGALATGGLGVMFRVSPLVVATSSLVLFAPVVIAGILQRRLVLSVRRGPVVREAPLR